MAVRFARREAGVVGIGQRYGQRFDLGRVDYLDRLPFHRKVVAADGTILKGARNHFFAKVGGIRQNLHQLVFGLRLSVVKELDADVVGEQAPGVLHADLHGLTKRHAGQRRLDHQVMALGPGDVVPGDGQSSERGSRASQIGQCQTEDDQ